MSIGEGKIRYFVCIRVGDDGNSSLTYLHTPSWDGDIERIINVIKCRPGAGWIKSVTKQVYTNDVWLEVERIEVPKPILYVR
jgi:hypothetical protein